MKGPSIAVMLGHSDPDEGEEGESGLAAAKSEAKDGARALISAISSKDPEAVYRAFGSLKSLCDKIHELEESGEEEEKEHEPGGDEEHESEKEEY